RWQVDGGFWGALSLGRPAICESGRGPDDGWIERAFSSGRIFPQPRRRDCYFKNGRRRLRDRRGGGTIYGSRLRRYGRGYNRGGRLLLRRFSGGPAAWIFAPGGRPFRQRRSGPLDPADRR